MTHVFRENIRRMAQLFILVPTITLTVIKKIIDQISLKSIT